MILEILIFDIEYYSQDCRANLALVQETVQVSVLQVRKYYQQRGGTLSLVQISRVTVL